MAESPQTSSGKSPEAEGRRSDIQALWRHIQDNPFAYLGSAAFLVAVVLVATFFRISRDLSHRDVASEYARALSIDDPAERSAALKAVAEKDTDLAARALYLHGESALGARDYASASEAFTRLRDTYPDFAFVPDAVEGLGFIEDDQDKYESALALYREVLEKWPDSAAGRRQPLNIARCLERSERLREAVQSYREQLEVFPGSVAALEAQGRLTELRTTQPELFEEETVDSAEFPEIDIGDALGQTNAENE